MTNGFMTDVNRKSWIDIIQILCLFHVNVMLRVGFVVVALFLFSHTHLHDFLCNELYYDICKRSMMQLWVTEFTLCEV